MSNNVHKGFIYLASPYSDPSAAVRQSREIAVSQFAAKLTKAGFNMFCPITQSERLKDFLETDLSHDRWMALDLAILAKASLLIVVKIDGWEDSRGVLIEREYAIEHGIPILYTNVDVDPKSLAKTVQLEEIMVTQAANNASIQEGVKDTVDKDRVGLIPYDAERAIARVRAYGNLKYKDPAKWYEYPEREGDFVEAAKRHIGKHLDAVLYRNRSLEDEESGISHLDHALTSLAMAVALRDKPRGRK